MADNYTLFSEVVPALNAKERAWAVGLLSAGGPDLGPRLAAEGIDVDLEEDLWPGFQWELLASRPKDLWVYSQEYGNPRHVTQFVKALLRRFRPHGSWTLTWAETCSRPRTGEFGGGGAVVTARGARMISAHAWVAAHSARPARGRRPAHKGR